MRTWGKMLGMGSGRLAAALLSLAAVTSPASAQYAPLGPFGSPPCPPTAPTSATQSPPLFPPSGPSDPGPSYFGGSPGKHPHDPSETSMLDHGAPNAFTTLLDVGPRYPGPLLPFGLSTRVRNLLPGFLHPAPTPARPAEFPNCAVACEEATPWTIQEGGPTNGFTEFCETRPPHPLFAHFGASRLLFTELLQPPAKVVECHNIWFRGEYLLWTPTAGPLNTPLVTTSSNPSVASFGQLNDPFTTILVNSGDNAIHYGNLPGFRLTGGVAINPLPPVEITGFLLNKPTTTLFSAGSLTNPTQFLALPFQDVQPALIIPGTSVGTESAVVISIPIGSGVGAQGGTINIFSEFSFWGIEANVFIPIGESDVLKLDALIGYRHLQLNESLHIDTRSGGSIGTTIFNGFLLPGGLFTTSTSDVFQTSNTYDGGQIGSRIVLGLGGRWSLWSDQKIAFGVTTARLNVNGISSLSQLVPGQATQSVPGGIFALPTNSGTLTTTVFGIVPEMNVALSFQLNERIRLYGGYNFLYWTTVARPGQFISHTIDSRQIPTSANFQPGVTFNGPFLPSSINPTSFTAQGIFVGIEIGF